MKFKYIIYQIKRNSDGKLYVGITRRELKKRISFHCTEAMVKGVNPYGLAVAIRKVRMQGYHFKDYFTVNKLEEFTSDVKYALSRENFWVNELNTRAPNGFNIQPGGSSAGSVENGIPISLTIDTKTYNFEAISEAIAWVNSNLNNDILMESTVRRRLENNWPIDEAFGLAEHIDERTLREPFMFDGEEYNSLSFISKVSGIPIDTLRSRLQRARENNAKDYDLALGLPIQWLGSSLLPHPTNSDFDGITSREFAKLTSIPQTTVSRRAKMYRTTTEKSKQTNEDLLAYLLKSQDRSQTINLELPSGEKFCGSINMFAQKVAEDPNLKQYKKSDFKYPTLRKRVQTLFREKQNPSDIDIFNAVNLLPNPSK